MSKATRFYVTTVGCLVLLALIGFFLARDHWESFVVVAFFTVPGVAALSLLGGGDPFAVAVSSLAYVLCMCFVTLFAAIYYALMLSPAWATLRKVGNRNEHTTPLSASTVLLALLQLALLAAHVVLVVTIQNWLARID